VILIKREVLGKCPVCDHELKITEVHCDHCKTTIRGDFKLCEFSKLSDEQKYFAMTFIKNNGNIKEIEKSLNISYPTVKNKLEDLKYALGFQTEIKNETNKEEILRKISSGEITPEEGIKMLK